MVSTATVHLIGLAIFCGAVTHATAPCNSSIIKNLARIPECYRFGQVPRLIPEFIEGTYVIVPPHHVAHNVTCVLRTQDKYDEYFFTAYFKDGSTTIYPYYQQRRSKYILEKGYDGQIYHVYWIHNHKGVSSYYRCIPESEAKKGDGIDMVAVVVGCDCLNSKETWAVVEQAKICFTKLGIKKVVPMKPCDC